LSAKNPESPAPAPAGQELLDRIAATLDAGFWQPLRQALPEVRRLHLVTHGELHRLPYDLGCPPEWTLATYPALAYYHKLRHEAPSRAFPAAAHLGLRVDDGRHHGQKPIPLVHADAELARQQWQPRPVHAAFDFAEAEPPADWLFLAAHGYTPENNAADAQIDLGPAGRIGFHDILRSPQRPWGVFLAACLLGDTRDDSDGDPLGFMGAFFLRGTRYIIAALQPISDFYMPLLVCLFYQSWNRQGGHPAAALAEAKRRILSGDWYEDTESEIRAAYRKVGQRFGDPTDAQIDALCAHSDRLPVADLCAWVRGFGEVE
jgi:hypothetical protein